MYRIIHYLTAEEKKYVERLASVLKKKFQVFALDSYFGQDATIYTSASSLEILENAADNWQEFLSLRFFTKAGDYCHPALNLLFKERQNLIPRAVRVMAETKRIEVVMETQEGLFFGYGLANIEVLSEIQVLLLETQNEKILNMLDRRLLRPKS